jgi:hypothetical protein
MNPIAIPLEEVDRCVCRATVHNDAFEARIILRKDAIEISR